MNHSSPSPVVIAAPIESVPRDVTVRWFSAPAQGEHCPFTDLGHAYYYTKLLKGPYLNGIVAAHLKAPGAAKGKHLIFWPALNSLLLGLAQKAIRIDRNGQLIGGGIDRRFREAHSAPISDKWLRPPVHGANCNFTGLSHGAFYALLNRAHSHLEICSLRLPGETRATTLVYLPSLHKYLVDLADQQSREANSPPGRRAA